MKKNVIGIAIVATAGLSTTFFAQDAKPDAAKSSPTFAAPLRTYNVTPSELSKDKFDINAAMAPVVPILESIALQSGLKLIISDELKAQNPHVFLQLRQITARNAIERIADEHNLSWGKVGTDTYLLGPSKPKTFKVLSLPEIKAKYQVPDQPNPNWQPFNFNGQRYYRMPLQSGAQKQR